MLVMLRAALPHAGGLHCKLATFPNLASATKGYNGTMPVLSTVVG